VRDEGALEFEAHAVEAVNFAAIDNEWNEAGSFAGELLTLLAEIGAVARTILGPADGMQ